MLKLEIKDYSPTQIEEMVDLMRETETRLFLDYESVEEMPDHRVREWTGLAKTQFNVLFSSFPSLLFHVKKALKTALGLRLTKCRT